MRLHSVRLARRPKPLNRVVCWATSLNNKRLSKRARWLRKAQRQAVNFTVKAVRTYKIIMAEAVKTYKTIMVAAKARLQIIMVGAARIFWAKPNKAKI
jgi:hypothetical protein